MTPFFRSFLALLLTRVAFAVPPAVKIENVARGFQQPTFVTHSPGDGNKLYVVEQRGIVQVLDLRTGTRSAFLQWTDRTVAGGEAGMHSIAFHPRFPDNRRVFVAYTSDRPTFGQLLSEFQAERPEEKPLLYIAKKFRNHNGGQIAFGPDGYLYMSTGDGGGAGDPDGNSQNKTSLLGKILRLDVDGVKPYAIPAGNPFARGGGAPEVYAWGLRNVWRFSFDARSNDLWAGDVGQDKEEEIDLIRRGGNYGWNAVEGAQCFKPAKGCGLDRFDKPVYSYGRGEGQSVTGGYVYRGSKIPALAGKYVFADYGSGVIWALTPNAARSDAQKETLLSTRGAITSFGEAPDGELYVVFQEGDIGRLAPGP